MNGTHSPFDFWGSAAPWLTLIALGFTVVLLHARPQERATYLNTLWLFFVGIGGAFKTAFKHALAARVASRMAAAG